MSIRLGVSGVQRRRSLAEVADIVPTHRYARISAAIARRGGGEMVRLPGTENLTRKLQECRSTTLGPFCVEQ